MGRFIEQRVVPYYLKVMRTNAVSAEPVLLSDLRLSGRQVTLDEVTRLLGDDWRPRVMGAWYSVVLNSRSLRDPLCASLVSSAGSLTAPPLALAATVVLGAEALPALHAYAVRAAADEYLGADGFVAACIEHLGGDPASPVTPDDRHTLRQMRTVAHALQAP